MFLITFFSGEDVQFAFFSYICILSKTMGSREKLGGSELNVLSSRV